MLMTSIIYVIVFLGQPIQIQLCKKDMAFSQFFAPFLKYASAVFEHFQKEMTLVVYIFPKLQTEKYVVKQMSKSLVSEHCSTVNMLKAPKHLWHLDDSGFIIFFISLEDFDLVICEFLGVFVNKLNAYNKYFLRNSQNLPQPIQMQLSKKTFS